MATTNSKEYGRIVSFRLNEDDANFLDDISKSLGVSRNQALKQMIQKMRFDKNLIRTKEILGELKKISSEQSRLGNNINQFAKYANQKREGISQATISSYNSLFSKYLELQEQLVKEFRGLYKELK